MKLILSPKDNLGKMTLTDVQGFALEGDTLLVVFESGRTRNYPLVHLWYYESHVDYHKTMPLSKDSEGALGIKIKQDKSTALLDSVGEYLSFNSDGNKERMEEAYLDFSDERVACET